MELLDIPPERLRAPQESINIPCRYTNKIVTIPTAGDFIILGEQHDERSKLLGYLLKQWRSKYTLVAADLKRMGRLLKYDPLMKAGGTITSGVEKIIPHPTDWQEWANFTRIALHRFKPAIDWWNDKEPGYQAVDEAIADQIRQAVTYFRDRNFAPIEISPHAWSQQFAKPQYRRELAQYSDSFTHQNPNPFLAIQKPESLEFPFSHPSTVDSGASRILFTAIHTVLSNVTESCVVVEDVIPEHVSIKNLKQTRNLLGMYGGSLLLTGHPPRSKRLKDFDGIFLIFNPMDLAGISVLERVWKLPKPVAVRAGKEYKNTTDKLIHFLLFFEGHSYIGAI